MDSERRKEYQAAYYLRNKARLKQVRAEYYERNKETMNAQSNAWFQANKEKARQQQAEKRKLLVEQGKKSAYAEPVKRYLQRRRLDAIMQYGGRCACCGETQIAFLAIDHVNNDGGRHRKEMKGGSIYVWLKRNDYPQDGRFQVLCHNCNMAKSLYGQCPHEVERSQALKVA